MGEIENVQKEFQVDGVFCELIPGKTGSLQPWEGSQLCTEVVLMDLASRVWVHMSRAL